jgi:hypothetical protein
MGAAAKNLVPQVIQSPGESGPVSALFLDDLSTRIPIIELKEFPQLSRFVLVIVLIPKSSLTVPATSSHLRVLIPIGGFQA